MTRKMWGALAIILLVQNGSAFGGEEPTSKLQVNLRAPRAEIRKILLGRTPIGSSLTDVTKFVSAQLEPTGQAAPAVEQVRPGAAKDGSSTKPRFAHVMRVYLGQYYDQAGVIFLTAPLVAQKEVSVEWRFDDHDRLIDLIVDKKASVY